MSVSLTSAIKTAAASTSTGPVVAAIKACPRDFVDIKSDDDQGRDGDFKSQVGSMVSGQSTTSSTVPSSAPGSASTFGSKSHERRIAETFGFHVRSVFDELTISRSTYSTPPVVGRGLETATALPSFEPITLRKVLVRAGDPRPLYAHRSTGAMPNAGGHAANAIEAMAETVSGFSVDATHVPISPGYYRGPMILKNGTIPHLRASGTAALGIALPSTAGSNRTMAGTQKLEDGHTGTKINVLPMVQAPKWTSGEKGAFFFVPITAGRESVDLEQALSLGHPLYQANGEFSATGVFLVDGVPLLTADPSRLDTTEQASAAGSLNAQSSSSDIIQTTEAPTPTDVSPDVQQRWLGLGKKPNNTSHAKKPASSAAKPTSVKGGALLGPLAHGVHSALGGLGISMPVAANHHHTGEPTATTTAHAKTGHGLGHGHGMHTAVHHQSSGPHVAGGHGHEHSTQRAHPTPHGQHAHNSTMATPTSVSGVDK